MQEYSESVCKSELFCRKSNEVVNSAMHELDKDQSSNCSVHTGLILDSQDFSTSKTIAPPSISETTAPPSSQHRCCLCVSNQGLL